MNPFKLVILIGLLISSCSGEANPRTVKTWISMSDTMVQRRKNELQPVIDSLCTLRSDSLYRIAYDSIYKKRLEEMNYLLDSIRPNEQ